MQQANRLKEIEENKKEIAELHDKNIAAAVNEKTAQLNAKLLNVNTMTGEVVFFKDTKVIKEFYGNEEKKGKKKVKSR